MSSLPFRRPVAWCLLSAALFAASTPASKLLLEASMGPLTLAGLLYLGAAVATFPSAWWAGRSTRHRDPANLRRLLGAVVFGGILGPVALLVGLQAAPSGSVSLWLNLETTATALLAWAVFKEHLEGRAWIANGLVVVAGVLLVAPGGLSMAPAALLVLLACVCWGLDNSFSALIDGYTPAQTTFVKGLVAGAVNLGLGLTLESFSVSPLQVVTALGVGALAYGASIVLYIKGAQQLGAARSQMIFASSPFMGLGLAWAVLGEPVLLAQVVAAGTMGVALALLLTGRHGHAHGHLALEHTHVHRHDDGHHAHTHPDVPEDAWHTHAHVHEPLEHDHPHLPDLHHRHSHP